MSKDYSFHAGEATVLAREGHFTDAMPEILRSALRKDDWS